jgi:hypothetical protein
VNAPSRHKDRKDTASGERPARLPRSGSGRTLLPALIALGGGSLLAAGSAAALQLGELRVQSSLGQPLRASIAYALNPNEHIQNHCIRLDSTASGLPAILNARVSVGQNVIRLTGRAAVNEPLIAVSLNIECPGTARLTREYTAFVDPATTAVSAESAAAATSETRITNAHDAGAAGNFARTRAPTRPVAAGTYRVQPGDSLSGIAARIAGRRMGLWNTVDALFAANPGAFIDGNRDLLLAGSELVIPATVLEPGADVAFSTRSAQPASPAASPAPQVAQAVPPAEADGPTSAIISEQSERTAQADSTAFEPAAAARAAQVPREGDVSLRADGPFVSPIESDADLSAVEPAEHPPAAARAPAANRPVSSARPADTGSRTWLMGLGGSGAALILALVLFGRQLKERFGSAVPLPYGRRGADAEGDDTTVAARVDLDASSLDVHLDDAGDLGDSGDIDLAQEFGYTMSGGTSNELRSAEDPFGSTAILESEILPSDETGEYDLSMIVDATQQELPDADDTTKDLRAIQLDEGEGEEAADGDYTLSRDVDYQILEQDYLDELTATQALNVELARAARDLSLEIEVDDATSVLPAEAGEDMADATAALPAEPDNASASTVEMHPGGGEAAEADPPAEGEREDTRADEDLTSTMADAENDPTAETEETKKLRVS